MELYEILSERRRQIGMSLEELVDASGVAKGTVAKIMSGITRNPQIESLKAITYALGLRLEDLDSAPSSSTISAAARALAEAYDKLDEHGRRVVSAVLELEVDRCSYPIPEERIHGMLNSQKEIIDKWFEDVDITDAHEA